MPYLLRRGGYRSIRQGLRELAYYIKGMLALGCRRDHTAEHGLITLLGSPAVSWPSNRSLARQKLRQMLLQPFLFRADSKSVPGVIAGAVSIG